LTALEAATASIDEFSAAKPDFKARDLLLSHHSLQVFLRACFGISEILPVNSEMLHGYATWLYRSPSGDLGILVAADVVPNLAERITPSARLLQFMTLLLHEAGHVALRHADAVAGSAAAGQMFPAMDEQCEYEAWLFAGFVRTFVVADYAVYARSRHEPHLLRDVL